MNPLEYSGAPESAADVALFKQHQRNLERLRRATDLQGEAIIMAMIALPKIWAESTVLD